MITSYTAMRAAEEARKRLPARLRAEAEDRSGAWPQSIVPLLIEAAAAIDHLYGRIAQLQKDAREEQLEAQRDARASAAEAYWQGKQGEDYGSY